MILRCLKCHGELNSEPNYVVCPRCAAHWAVVDGVPRFFQVDGYYWGEIQRQEANELLAAARKDSWKGAVRTRFADHPNMLNGLLSLQRAAWLPLLGLDSEAVALDIGCGYGAITHSLALSLANVCAVEAVPERIAFTRERLKQEGLDNVRLIQASATALPFFESSFDLIVTNGILEWVGEWDWEGNPRTVQLKFLSALHRLLKDGGVLVIGIENRIGFGLLMGEIDHSGIPYTSLLPRRLATFALQRTSKAHHRTVLNPKREYRTYTYSRRGYHKLLSEAGFSSVAGYWADPGYNEPSWLIPLSARPLIREHFLDRLDHPGPRRRFAWLRSLKRAFSKSRWLPWFVPDFVLIASKNPHRATKVEEWIQKQLEREFAGGNPGMTDSGRIILSASTHSFSDKSVLHFWEPRAARNSLIVKTNVRRPRRAREDVQAEFRNLTRVGERLTSPAGVCVRVPRPIASLKLGDSAYCFESLAQGAKFSRLVRRPGYFEQPEKVRADFGVAMRAATELSLKLKGVPEVSLIDSAWLEIPEPIKASPDLCVRLERLRRLLSPVPPPRHAWIQHGDFTVENVFLNHNQSQVEVIDWGELAAGLPPLYDHLALVLSAGDLTPWSGSRNATHPSAQRPGSFLNLLFPGNRVAPLLAQLLMRAGEQLEVPRDLIPSLIVEFLLIRTHYYNSQAEFVMARVHLNLLRHCLEQAENLSFRSEC